MSQKDSSKNSEEPIGFIAIDRKQKIHEGFNGTEIYKGSILNEPCAIKRIIIEDTRESYMRELDALRSLRHPNIIHCYGFIECEQWYYIVLDLCSGSLENLVLNEINGQFKQVDRCHILSQIVDGLAYIHERDIVHRDIRPKNVLLRRDKLNQIVAVIADFGFSKSADLGATHSNIPGIETKGSIGWMAPEVFINREYKYAADVFSLGIVFYYFFANNFSISKHPFIIGKNDHKDPQKIQNNIKNDARREKPITGVELNYADDRYSASHLINLMLAWEPNERPLAQDLKHHPLFWSASRKLKFIKTINFVVKAEKSPVSSPQSTNKSLQLKHSQKGAVEKAIESIAYDVFGKDWIDTIDQDENNPNFSQALANHIIKNSHDYVSGMRSKQMCQLLRMIRNYNEHKEDHVFDLGDGITYFTVIFPKLIIELYKTMQPISQMQIDGSTTLDNAIMQLQEFYPISSLRI